MQYLEMIKDNIGLITAFLGLFGIVIEKSTIIKINPYTMFFKWIGKIVMGETREQIEEIKKEVIGMKTSLCDIDKKVDTNEIDRIRKEISDFADSLRRQEPHTRDQFERVIKIHDKYNELLKANKKTNGVINTEYKYINTTYIEFSQYGGFI